MPTFKTKYDKHERFISNPGNPIKDVMAPELDRYGNRVIKKKDQIDLYSMIQAYRDECDINILMAKFTNGDRTALMQRVGAYLDLSQIPDNFSDMMNMTTQAQSVFDSLPASVKEMFGNNLNNFLANSKTKEFEEVMSKSPEQLRLEKVLHSDQNMKTNRDDAQREMLKPKPVLNPGDIVLDPDPTVVDKSLSAAVDNLVYGKVKLNESK